MTRVATEGRPRRIAQWISERAGDPRRKYRPLPGKSLRRKLLRRTPRSVASRYYQLLSGHAAVGPYLRDRARKTDDVRCWWCGGGKQQTRPPSLHGVQGLATSDREVVEGHWEGPRAEAPEGPIWQGAVEGKVYGGGFGFSGSTRVGPGASALGEGCPRRHRGQRTW